ARIGRELKLVLVRATHGAPRERRELLDPHPASGPHECWSTRRGTDAAACDERNSDRCAHDQNFDSESPHVPGPSSVASLRPANRVAYGASTCTPDGLGPPRPFDRPPDRAATRVPSRAAPPRGRADPRIGS